MKYFESGQQNTKQRVKEVKTAHAASLEKVRTTEGG